MLCRVLSDIDLFYVQLLCDRNIGLWKCIVMSICVCLCVCVCARARVCMCVCVYLCMMDCFWMDPCKVLSQLIQIILAN